MIEGLLGAALLLALIASAALLLMARDRVAAAVWRWRNPPEKLAMQRKQFLQRLQAPDWSFYAEHLQRPVPQALQTWFAKPDALAKNYHFRDYYVAFSPIDTAALAEAWVLPGVVPFAESNGDPIYVKPGAKSENAVFITYHDGGDTELLVSSVETFLAELRDAA